MKKTMILVAVAGLSMLGSAVAQADYECLPNYWGQQICRGATVRDNNTGSVGTVQDVDSYDDVDVYFYSGPYAGMTEDLGVNALTPVGGYNPYPPQPVPPQPYPPQPVPPGPGPVVPGPGYTAHPCYNRCVVNVVCTDGCPYGAVCSYVPPYGYQRVMSCGH